MLANEIPNSLFYNDIEQANHYWNRFGRDEESSRSYVDKLRMLNGLFEQISFQNSVFIVIWDIAKDQLVYAVDKKKVVGYDMALYLADNGIHFSLSNVLPDFRTAGRLMQLKAFEYIVQCKEPELNKIIINFDAEYKKSNGEYFHFLQQTVCLEFDSNGSPALFLSYIYDITYFKKRESANLIITTPDEIKLWNFNFHNNSLNPLQPLTKQEDNVLSYLAKGKSSKEIANELFISPHTVDTHRRNLLAKTNCLDTSGLVTYAKLVGLF